MLRYFSPYEGLELQCDASQKGLGACLMQSGQPIAYASRSLTQTETQYAQIEKEMLAIVFGVERFEQYAYGRKVKIETDHKPLESIFKKSLLSAPKRLQRMLLRLQKFDLVVTYKRGSQMYLADTLSRAFLPSKGSASGQDEVVLSVQDNRGETAKDAESINMLQHLLVSDDTLKIIQHETKQDATMQELEAIIKNGWPDNQNKVPENLRDYYSFCDELGLQNGLIFKGERLVVPGGAKDYIRSRVHSSHIGIQGCLRRARESVYWPGMNSDLEEFISKCPTCNAHQAGQPKEPMICHEIPSRPWEKIACDLFELNGRDYLITADYNSSFFEIDRLYYKTAKETISKLKVHLSRHGLPDQLISDNGPPFNAFAFADFAHAYNFEHITSSPGYPQSNGKIENAVKTAKNLMTKAVESEQDPHLVLLDWRNTPTEGLGSSPAQCLFGRRTRTLLPTSSTLLNPKIPTEVPQKLMKQKAKQAMYYTTTVQKS